MLTDGHCHPTDDPESLANIANLPCRMVAMSAQLGDLDIVSKTADRFPDKVIPAFGLHPWFSHLVTLADNTEIDKREHYRSIFSPQPELEDPLLEQLPMPVNLKAHSERIIQLLIQHPNAILGEVGLDKNFRVKLNGTLLPFKVKIEHQRSVLQFQLQVAKTLGRSVSLHGVGASQALFEEVKAAVEPKKVDENTIGSICLHSYGGTADFYTQCWMKLPVRVYLSVATLINGSMQPQKLAKMLSGADPYLVLSESDFNSASSFQVDLIKQSLQLFAKHFNWTEPAAEEHLESNFNAFIKSHNVA